MEGLMILGGTAVLIAIVLVIYFKIEERKDLEEK